MLPIFGIIAAVLMIWAGVTGNGPAVVAVLVKDISGGKSSASANTSVRSGGTYGV
jgi:shikimate kinase